VSRIPEGGNDHGSGRDGVVLGDLERFLGFVRDLSDTQSFVFSKNRSAKKNRDGKLTMMTGGTKRKDSFTQALV
jgi:hypothetical protein